MSLPLFLLSPTAVKSHPAESLCVPFSKDGKLTYCCGNVSEPGNGAEKIEMKQASDERG